ncbi:hypothetical protein R5R35_010464 [Gryllus longicercus]|uniref:Uncharacterized protein n=1 Tax=Gryllus longicercus TaxID=2509291 RepID=A0AAN9VZL1_9ORTH
MAKIVLEEKSEIKTEEDEDMSSAGLYSIKEENADEELEPPVAVFVEPIEKLEGVCVKEETDPLAPCSTVSVASIKLEEESNIQGLWKRLKMSTKEELGTIRNEVRQTGGGSSVDPLPMDYDSDAIPFQEGQIEIEGVAEAEPEVEVVAVPPENEWRSGRVPQKNKKSSYEEQLLQMAKKEHEQKLADSVKRMEMAIKEHELEMRILEVERKIKLRKLTELMQM